MQLCCLEADVRHLKLRGQVSRGELHRRVQGHKQSLDKEEKDDALEKVAPDLSVYISGAIDWHYLQQARVTLLECRRVLSQAYVFSFFMFDHTNFAQVLFTTLSGNSPGTARCQQPQGPDGSHDAGEVELESICVQDMTREENLTLQHLFEDSMATLTQAVEHLSQCLTTELANLTGKVTTAHQMHITYPSAVRC